MRRLALIALATLCSACADTEFNGNARLAAEAAGDTLTSERVAKYLERVDPKVRSRALAEFVTQTWIDYTLLAHATVASTDLTTDAYLQGSVAPARGAAVVRQWFRTIDAHRAPATDAEIEAAYVSDTMRVFEYLVWPPPARDDRTRGARVRHQADSVRDELIAGARFVDVLAALKHRGALADGGIVLVTTHGETTPRFDDVAWRLDPGDATLPAMTRAGLEVARRPRLAESRPLVAAFARAANTARLDSLFVDSIGTASRLVVQESAIPALRRYVLGLASDTPSVTVAKWSGGSLTLADLGARLGALPPTVARRLFDQSDDGLASLVRRIARGVVLERAAEASGVATPTDTIAAAVTAYHAEIAQARAAAGLTDPKLSDPSTPLDSRLAIARAAVAAFIDSVVTQPTAAAMVPAGLSTALRARLGFRLHPAGIADAVTRATTLWGTGGVVSDSARKALGIPPEP